MERRLEAGRVGAPQQKAGVAGRAGAVARLLAALLLAAGGASLLAQLALLALLHRYDWSAGEGAIAGIVFLATGLTAILTAHRLRSRPVLAVNISLNIVSVVLAGLLTALSTLNIIFTPYDLSYTLHGVGLQLLTATSIVRLL